MPVKDDFTSISPKDRKAKILFDHLGRCLEADDDELYHKRVIKFNSALSDGKSPERQAQIDLIYKKAGEKKEKNSFSTANAVLEVLVEVLNDMGFSEGDINYTLAENKDVEV
jgi:hypothetical protein